jgi:nicotinamidase-related amidase
MPPRNPDLHGNAPDTSRVALVLVDVINDLEFEDGDRVLPHALAMAKRLAALAARARRARVPVIYVNDNFGRWRSDFRTLLERCLQRPVRGRPLARRLRPRATDYVVLKTKHSAFYATTLELLLRYLEASTLVLAGLSGDRCVLFSASDAFMRDFRLWIPADCVASLDPERNRRALDEMARLLDADLTESTQLDLSRSGVRRRARAAAARARSGPARAAPPARRSHAPAA